MRAGEVYLARFPFGDVPGMKLRPVLLLTGSVGVVPEVLVAYISSVVPPQLLPSDILLDPANPVFASTRLKMLRCCVYTSWLRSIARAWRGTSASLTRRSRSQSARSSRRSSACSQFHARRVIILAST